MRTRQMALSVRSMVKTMARAESTRASTPAVPRRLALLANWVR